MSLSTCPPKIRGVNFSPKASQALQERILQTLNQRPPEPVKCQRRMMLRHLFLNRAAMAYGVPKKAISSRTKRWEVCEARHAVYLALWMCSMTLREIAGLMGRTECGTIRHGIDRIMGLAESYPDTRTRLCYVLMGITHR